MIKASKKNIKIIIAISSLILLIYIYFIFIKKKQVAIPIKISETDLATSQLTNEQINKEIIFLHNKIYGITFFEAEFLTRILSYTDVDFVLIYNAYLNEYNKSLYQDFNSENYWLINYDLATSVKDRFENLNINY